mgnify:CR=1 FL=1
MAGELRLCALAATAFAGVATAHPAARTAAEAAATRRPDACRISVDAAGGAVGVVVVELRARLRTRPTNRLVSTIPPRRFVLRIVREALLPPSP